MKRCARCCAELPREAFNLDRSAKDGRDAYCRPCRKAQKADYYARNRERVIKKVTEHQAAHPEERRARHRAWYAKNRDRERAKQRARHASNPVPDNERVRRSRAKHPETHRAGNRRWREANRRRVADLALLRVARQKNAPVVEKIDREAIYRRDSGMCHICGKPTAWSEFSLDHLIPLSKGGEHSAKNVATAHRLCNSRRNAGALPAQLRLLS